MGHCLRLSWWVRWGRRPSSLSLFRRHLRHTPPVSWASVLRASQIWTIAGLLFKSWVLGAQGGAHEQELFLKRQKIHCGLCTQHFLDFVITFGFLCIVCFSPPRKAYIFWKSQWDMHRNLSHSPSNPCKVPPNSHLSFSYRSWWFPLDFMRCAYGTATIWEWKTVCVCVEGDFKLKLINRKLPRCTVVSDKLCTCSSDRKTVCLCGEEDFKLKLINWKLPRCTVFW